MATKKTTVVRRTSGSPKLRRLENRLQSQRRRRSQEKKQRFADMSAVAGGAALGALRRWDVQNPIDIPGIDDSAVYSVALYLLGDQFVGGKAGEFIRGAAVGMAAVAAHEMISDAS